jgi:hypothetical protein
MFVVQTIAPGPPQSYRMPLRWLVPIFPQSEKTITFLRLCSSVYKLRSSVVCFCLLNCVQSNTILYCRTLLQLRPLNSWRLIPPQSTFVMVLKKIHSPLLKKTLRSRTSLHFKRHRRMLSKVELNDVFSGSKIRQLAI